MGINARSINARSTNAGALRIVRVLASALLLAVAACSGGAEPDDPGAALVAETPATPTAVATEQARIEPDSPNEAVTPEKESPTPAAVATAVEPAVRMPENPGTVEATNWIARNFMDAQSVELVWSEVEGADVYRVYRLPTAQADYDAIQAGDVSSASLVYEGTEVVHIDDSVESGLFLTYVLVAQVGGDLTSPRWTQALTIDDTTPPTPVTGLEATNTAQGVLLEWEPSSDDVEFAAYSVSLVVDGQEQYIGGGADESQTSFLDTDTSAGTRTYVVTAVDFHDNQSQPASVEITRSS